MRLLLCDPCVSPQRRAYTALPAAAQKETTIANKPYRSPKAPVAEKHSPDSLALAHLSFLVAIRCGNYDNFSLKYNHHDNTHQVGKYYPRTLPFFVVIYLHIKKRTPTTPTRN